MCNWQVKATELLNRNVPIHFRQEFLHRFPIDAVQRGHCLVCGRPLSYQEMFPQGKAPRYMCDCCYEGVAYSGPKQACITCGGQLPQDKIYNRMRNPRELTHALHSGPCEDYHTLLAGVVLGVLSLDNRLPMLPQYVNNNRIPYDQFYLSRQRVPDFIDVEPIKPNRHVKLLKLPE